MHDITTDKYQFVINSDKAQFTEHHQKARMTDDDRKTGRCMRQIEEYLENKRLSQKDDIEFMCEEFTHD
ncbi:hypothetical protein [Pseudoalteromonas denitrificans]|uniref:Uncharacterized protein n=1 Tax=Pseudoalteromonas denitrificans DSM 6059 TaxID=1123010 RepID=A0A1I1FZA5_9GAMM|nr:hypothetical protein [Pseudoalteromonas denitrificans]SFC04366.1 hypothetical protein SAMN02745724_00741 [Pseudoalteromonas denitrificans DSM 6059]